MKILSNRRADVGLATIILIIVIFAFIYALIEMGGRECRSNNECGKGDYCGSDFACHEIPVIERSSGSTDFTMPALILGFAMVITALILKWDKIRSPKGKYVKRVREDPELLEEEEESLLKAP